MCKIPSCISVQIVLFLKRPKGNRKNKIILTGQEPEGKNKMMMTIEEIREYLLEELKEEKNKMLMNKESHYSYLFMLCNDMGRGEEE